MTILFYCAGDDGQAMLAALKARLPEQDIVTTESCRDRHAVTQAIVWHPPLDFFDNLPNLSAVLALAAGVDQLLTHPGLPASVPIVRLRDAGMATKMAEYVLYGVLHAHLDMPRHAVAQREGLWQGHHERVDASRINVGVLGSGVLGSAAAERCRDNGYRVRTWGRSPRQLPGITHHAGRASLPDFLTDLQVLVCLLPLTADTRGLLCSRLFDQLADGAYLIHAARGPHLVEDDLISALDTGKLTGALLDVFHQEPMPVEHPFWHHPRITVTPHCAAPSPVASSVAQIAGSLDQLAKGQVPDGLVDRHRGY